MKRNVLIRYHKTYNCLSFEEPPSGTEADKRLKISETIITYKKENVKSKIFSQDNFAGQNRNVRKNIKILYDVWKRLKTKAYEIMENKK